MNKLHTGFQEVEVETLLEIDGGGFWGDIGKVAGVIGIADMFYDAYKGFRDGWNSI